jgi:hypothetical protein
MYASIVLRACEIFSVFCFFLDPFFGRLPRTSAREFSNVWQDTPQAMAYEAAQQSATGPTTKDLVNVLVPTL